MKLIPILVLALSALAAKADGPICVNNANLACINIKDFYVFCIDTNDKTITLGSLGGRGSRSLRLHKDSMSSFEGDLPGDLKIQADDEITGTQIINYTLELTPKESQPNPDRLLYNAKITAGPRDKIGAPAQVNCTTL